MIELSFSTSGHVIVSVHINLPMHILSVCVCVCVSHLDLSANVACWQRTLGHRAQLGRDEAQLGIIKASTVSVKELDRQDRLNRSDGAAWMCYSHHPFAPLHRVPRSQQSHGSDSNSAVQIILETNPKETGRLCCGILKRTTLSAALQHVCIALTHNVLMEVSEKQFGQGRLT